MDAQLLQYLDLLSQGRASEADPALLRELSRRYPYFSKTDTTLAEKLKAEGLSSDDIKELQASIISQSANPDTVSAALGLESDADFYGESKPAREKMTTETTIDSFLERYGNSADNDKEMELLEKLIFNPVAPDYTASLEALEPAAHPQAASTDEPCVTSSRQDQLIDAFIAKSNEDTPLSATIDIIAANPQPSTPTEPPTTTPEHQPDTSESRQHALLTESLAKIYIKKGRYAKAFEIIHSLSLNYPEKSCYFADQLRFLHKLMLIQELQTKNDKK